MKWSLGSLQAEWVSQVKELYYRFPSHVDILRKALLPLQCHLPAISEVDMHESHLPFLIAVTDQVLALHDRMQWFRKSYDEESLIQFSLDQITPLVSIPPTPCYLAVSVENGSLTKIQLPLMGAVKVSVPERSGLTVDEGVALISYKKGDKLLWDYSLLLTGSEFNGQSRYNYFYQHQIITLKMYAGEYDYGVALNHTIRGGPILTEACSSQEKLWGTPTCLIRM